MAEHEMAEASGAPPRKGMLAAVGAIGAAFLASLCCVGPLVFVAFGVGAGLASSFEPLRPLFTMATIALLAVGFYIVYGRQRFVPRSHAATCAPDDSCPVPRHPARERTWLWIAAVIALVFLTFPQWSLLLL